MSYIAPRVTRLECAIINWTAAASGTDATLSLAGHSWQVAPVISGNTILLPSGHYRLNCAAAIIKTNAAQNVRFALFADGVQFGVFGQSDMYLATGQGNIDTAEGVVSVSENATVALSVRIIATESTFPTIVSDESTVVVWRCNL